MLGCDCRCRGAAAIATAARTAAYWQTLSLRACPALPAGGINDQQYVKLRSEAKAPFRLTRIIFLGGLAAGAALGLFIITGRLLAALQGERALLGCPTGRVLGFQAVRARTWALLCWCAVCGMQGIIAHLQGCARQSRKV